MEHGLVLYGGEIPCQQRSGGLSHLVELAHRGELAIERDGAIVAGEGHHGDLVGGIPGRLGAMDVLARRHQEGLVIPEGHHQVALA
ncbi:hypothetical protein D3C72_2016420 [compost metagenome]